MSEVSFVKKVVSEKILPHGETPVTPKASSAPIGMFDSGVGGLTVLKEVMRQMPSEDVIYFGDTVHVPYGSRPAMEILRLDSEIISFLLKSGVKMIIMACGTSSALALSDMKKKFKLPMIGVIQPGASAAIRATRNYKIGVIATEAAVKSEAYQIEIRHRERGIEVFSQACPLFVPLVEGNFIETPETKKIAQEYLNPLIKAKVDTLILGCTHYPHLSKVISEIMGPEVKLIDPAVETAAEAKKMLEKAGLTKDIPRPPIYEYIVSGSPARFQETGSKLLGRPILSVRQETI